MQSGASQTTPPCESGLSFSKQVQRHESEQFLILERFRGEFCDKRRDKRVIRTWVGVFFLVKRLQSTSSHVVFLLLNFRQGSDIKVYAILFERRRVGVVDARRR
jgi:hypothetical protein